MSLELDNYLESKGISRQLVQPVQVSCMPTELKKSIHELNLCRPNQCYDNVWRIVLDKQFENLNVEYVLGFGVRVLPVSHSLLKIGDQYFDPTWEMFFEDIGKEYAVIDSWNLQELLIMAERDDGYYPPMIDDLRGMKNYTNLFKAVAG